MDAAAVGWAYWAAIENRDWSALGALLAAEVVYDLPQTREQVRGRDAYVQFNREYPGDWHLVVTRLVGAGAHAASWTSFTVNGQAAPGITFFDLDAGGLIVAITDFLARAVRAAARS